VVPARKSPIRTWEAITQIAVALILACKSTPSHFTRNPKLLHFGDERRRFDAETRSSARAATHNPITLSEYFQDVITIRFGQCYRLGLNRRDRWEGGNLKHVAPGQNHCSFDKILQFSNISGPRVPH